MNWMYKGVSGLVDKEEYLKGRKIDKTFEIIEREENNIKGDLDSVEASIPQSLFDTNINQNNGPNGSTVTIDLATKLREDPLYEIRVKQREQRRQLLDNPLKLKKLKHILESTLNEDKHKKHKKSKRKRSEESDHKYEHKTDRRDRDYDRSYRKSRHSDDSNRKSYESNRHKDKQSSESRHWDRNNDQKLSHKSKHENRFEDKQTKRHKLSEEEIEKKRREMIENAVWRQCERQKNVKAFNDEELEENKFNSSGKSAQFIKPMLNNVTERDSLEDRIRQKRFTSQRKYNSMDTNFAKKS